MMDFEPLGLDHVVLRVRDQTASQRFYLDVLGCTLDRVNEPIRLVQLRFGASLIDLLPGRARLRGAWTTSVSPSDATTCPRLPRAFEPGAWRSKGAW